MRRERQIAYLERIADAGPRMRGLHASASYVNQASAYTDRTRFEVERSTLFRGGPVVFALSCELAKSGSYVSAVVGGVPIVVIRQTDSSLRAVVNACRHRASPLVDELGRGDGLTALTCPYHSWTYELDGQLRAKPGSEGAFDDVEMNCDLHAVDATEQYGIVFVRIDGTAAGALDRPAIDQYLAGAEDDLESFGLDDYTHIETRTSNWNMNWKLVLDTFAESYHIRTLHRSTIAPHYLSYSVASEAFGPHGLSIGLRRSVLKELDKPKDEWNLLPHSTIQYLLVPNIVLTHQIDHVEMWRVQPVDVQTSVVTTSIYAPSAPHSENARNYFVKNLDVLLGVTNTEDFPLMERIQTTLDSGAVPEVVYGRNEPPLVHFHQSVNKLLTAQALTP